MSEGNKKNFRKRLIVVFAIILAALLALYGITLAIPYFQKITEPEESEIVANFDFYPADYSENIFDDPEYAALIETGVLLYHNGNISITMDQENKSEYGDQVQLLVDMVYSIINGNAQEYNSYFSERYFENNKPKEGFTMQKIYNGAISYFDTETVTENGVTYEQYTYKLIYNIYENNGTFRKDIGDGAREQYITLSKREGKLLIDSIEYAQYK